jgi:5'-methylthioadenosine phosphorylase
LPATRGCACGEALRHAIVTDKAMIPAETRTRLSLLIDKYL